MQIDNLTGHIAIRQGSIHEGLRTQIATAGALRKTDPALAARIVADAALATYGAGFPDEVWPAALAALRLLGHDVGGHRLPLVEANEEETARVRECLERLGAFHTAAA